MKQAAMAVLLVFGVSLSAGVLACDGSGHSSKSGSTAPATPAPTK